MGSSAYFPSHRERSSTTSTVAELLAGLTLPTIEPLATDIVSMSHLPALPLPGVSEAGSEPHAPKSQLPESQLDAARLLLNDCGEQLALLAKHQNSCAALAAVVIERFESAALLEGNILAFDRWQRELTLRSIRAEVAGILLISEAAASRLIEHATNIVRLLPATLSHMSSGELGWEYAVIIAEETKLLREAGLPSETIDAFEAALLTKAEGSSLPSFREKARRLRERQYPETIPARTRKSYEDRYLQVNRGQDGMSWLSLYAPAPTLEAIWDQCTSTAQAAQGPHEQRTLTQLRADVAAALLLNQSMAENQIFAPAIMAEEVHERPPEDGAAPSESGAREPAFWPDPWGEPSWRPTAMPPPLLPAAAGSCAADAEPPACLARVWPPLPRVTPVLLIPALSFLGATNEPAWLEGTGPISMEVAKRLMDGASSFYRVLTDPVSNVPLDLTPERYRITSAMRLMLRIRDEYCEFPGCMNKAACSEVDHIQAFSARGQTVYGNLEHLCKPHHQLKHLKDDRTRNGEYRTDQSPERQQVRLRGWTPLATDSGIAWTSPTGIYYPPEPRDSQPPVYPEWIRDIIVESLEDLSERMAEAVEPAYLAEEQRELMKDTEFVERRNREIEE